VAPLLALMVRDPLRGKFCGALELRSSLCRPNRRPATFKPAEEEDSFSFGHARREADVSDTAESSKQPAGESISEFLAAQLQQLRQRGREGMADTDDP